MDPLPGPLLLDIPITPEMSPVAGPAALVNAFPGIVLTRAMVSKTDTTAFVNVCLICCTLSFIVCSLG
jgi:hypothetical protein